MLRDVSLKDISDGNLYEKNDVARLGCNDCKGCSSCCQEMGDTIILDPLDVYRITSHFAMTFEGLLGQSLSLRVVDGLVLPGINMETKNGACSFLNDEGRCSIHSIRPGICRLFPLGRVYEDEGFKYFLQTEECKVKNRSKVKIKKWIGEPDMDRYEHFVMSWHRLIVKLREYVVTLEDPEEIREVSMGLLDRFFLTGYEMNRDFYEQVEERIRDYRLPTEG